MALGTDEIGRFAGLLKEHEADVVES